MVAFVVKRATLPQPNACPKQDFCSIMMRCWTYVPKHRPSGLRPSGYTVPL